MSNKCLCDADAELEKVMWSRTGSRSTGQDLRERDRIGDVRFFWIGRSLSVGASFPVYVCDFVGVGGMGDIAEGGRVLYL